MIISFLVGNGFDIASGVRTSYSSFYDWYCKQPHENLHIYTFKKEIQNDIDNGGENWADFEMGLGKYTAKFSAETVDDFIECYEDAQRGIIEYLEKETKGRYDAISESESEKLREGVAKFYQELSPAGFDKIDSIFKAKENEDCTIHIMSFNYTRLIDKCAEVLAASPLKAWAYGNSSKLRRLKVNQTVIHIHGTSDEFPILGMNDSSQIVNQDLLSVPYFAEMLIKPQGVAAVERLWHVQAENIIASSQIICIFGMSLGDSDSRWWQLIMDWLRDNYNTHLIIFWHTDIELNRISAFRYAREVDKVKAKFTKYSDYEENVIKSIKERIHVVFNPKHFLQVEFERPLIGAVSG